jgi:hypothetical protein
MIPIRWGGFDRSQMAAGHVWLLRRKRGCMVSRVDAMRDAGGAVGAVAMSRLTPLLQGVSRRRRDWGRWVLRQSASQPGYLRPVSAFDGRKRTDRAVAGATIKINAGLRPLTEQARS